MTARTWARLRAAWRALRRQTELDREMDEEMRFHVEMEAERLVRERGLDRAEAWRQARLAFGGAEKYKDEGRAARGFRWIDALALDCRLGVRLLVKHKGLTLVGGFAIAVAIAIGATFVEVVGEMVAPSLPFPDGDRLVAVVDDGAGAPGTNEFAIWRDTLASLEQVSAYRTVAHNLVSANALPEPIQVAEISPSAFGITRVPPLAGRYLLPGDERPEAPPVVVIGHQAWQSRFGGDPGIVGRAITLGGLQRTVVGIMPEGFRFPFDHQFWIPLGAGSLGRSPTAFIFGMLAPGVTAEAAQAELTAVMQRAATGSQDARDRIRPRLIPFTHALVDITEPELVWVLRVAQLLISGLCFVVAVNLAILIYAQTLARAGEIAVRTALGASRRRILAQLFVEALALSVLGAAVGLALASLALDRLQVLANLNGHVPFWIDFRLSPGSVLYGAGLAIVAAGIMGVLPGLKLTGRHLTAGLRELGATATPLGRTWTALVVMQVAAAVAVLPVSVYLAAQVIRLEVAGPGFPAEEFAVASITTADGNLGRPRQLDLMSRLRAEPGVAAVTFSSSIPGFGPGREIVIEHDDMPRRAPLMVSRFDVAVDMFDVYRARILAGRTFDASDLPGRQAIVVNRSFVEEFLPNRAALGARIRYQDSTAWHEILGVVDDIPDFPSALRLDTKPNVYHPVAPGDLPSVVVSVRFAGPVRPGFVERVRELGARVDPALQFRRLTTLGEFYGQLRSVWRSIAWGAALVTLSVLLLSAAGIYAMMSFTVVRRTREIGIRTALGADSRQILVSIFGRASGQLGLGVLAGSLASGAVLAAAGVGMGFGATLLSTVAVILLSVGLAAALGPARRCLGIQPSDVLRTDV